MLRDLYSELVSGIKRLKTGITGIDELLDGGIPEDFFVAITGEPGCGKTIFCIHFINQGIIEDDKCIYVTTEESKESIIRQASQFNMKFTEAINKGEIDNNRCADG